jgi:chromosome segregation ATPase
MTAKWMRLTALAFVPALFATGCGANEEMARLERQVGTLNQRIDSIEERMAGGTGDMDARVAQIREANQKAEEALRQAALAAEQAGTALGTANDVQQRAEAMFRKTVTK